jgi:hypothetical protein
MATEDRNLLSLSPEIELEFRKLVFQGGRKTGEFGGGHFFCSERRERTTGAVTRSIRI